MSGLKSAHPLNRKCTYWPILGSFCVLQMDKVELRTYPQPLLVILRSAATKDLSIIETALNSSNGAFTSSVAALVSERSFTPLRFVQDDIWGGLRIASKIQDACSYANGCAFRSRVPSYIGSALECLDALLMEVIYFVSRLRLVSAKAGTHPSLRGCRQSLKTGWVPAFAGMTY